MDLQVELDEQSRGEVASGLVALIRATLAAAGVVDDAHDFEVAAQIEVQLQRVGRRDLDVAVGNVVLERYRALRATIVAGPAVKPDRQAPVHGAGDALFGTVLRRSVEQPPDAVPEPSSEAVTPLDESAPPENDLVASLDVVAPPEEDLFAPLEAATEQPSNEMTPPEDGEITTLEAVTPLDEIASLDVVASPEAVTPLEAITEGPLDVIAPPEDDLVASLDVVTVPEDLTPLEAITEELLDVIAPPEDDEIALSGAVSEQLAEELTPTEEESVPQVGDSYWESRGVAAQSETALEEQHRQVDRRSVVRVALVWVRNIGLIALLFVAWQLWGTSLIEHHDQAALASEFRQLTPAKNASTIPELLSSMTATTPPGSLVARLQIPAIGLNQYVVEGTSSSQLTDGPGHYIGTALPGYSGNVAIAGHRTAFGAQFSRLGAIVPGDAMYLTTTSGERFTYRVVIQPTAVLPSDGSILDEFGDDRLTLVTSTPEISASQRLVVVGEYQPPNGAKKALSAPLPTTGSAGSGGQVASDLATPGWQWGHIPIVLLSLALLSGLGIAYRRIDARLGRVAWLLMIPVWLVGLILLFSVLAGLLPTTL